jgi:hypothetical protein
MRGFSESNMVLLNNGFDLMADLVRRIRTRQIRAPADLFARLPYQELR